jgi:hypothetical protein
MKGDDMLIEGVVYCHLCGQVILPNDGMPAKAFIKGKLCQFNFHNRTPNDCIAQEIRTLEQQFAVTNE